MAEKLTAAEQVAIDEENAILEAIRSADNMNELKDALAKAIMYVNRT